MKKLLTLIISAVIVAALAIGIIVVVVNHQNEQEHNLSVTTMYGGTLELTIDNASYSIESDEGQTFSVKKKSKVSIKAVADETHTFLSWELNGKSYGENAELNLSIEKDTELHAKFKTKVATAKVTDGNEIKNVNIDLSKNLLDQLNVAYNSNDWYTYSFKIGETAVTDTTKITAETEITAVRTAIDYKITYKYGENEIATRTYNYSNLTVENPAFPSSEDYAELKYFENFAWDYKIPALSEKPADIVANLTKTAIEYPITFKLQDGYKFADETTELSSTYTYNVEDPTNPVIAETPDLGEIATVAEHYNLAWVFEGVTYTYNKETAVVVNSAVEATKYYITFKHEGEVIAKEVYTIEDATITVPELPIKEHYTVAWGEYTLVEFKNQEVNTVSTPVEYTVTFTLPEGKKFVVSEGTSGNTITRTYTIENTYVTAPTEDQIPEIKHYTKEWKNYDLTKGGNITVTLKEVVYTVTYKFDDSISDYYNLSPIKETYTISSIQELKNGTDEEYRTTLINNLTPRTGYNLVWDGAIIKKDSLADATIIIKEEAIVYTATFKHKGEEFAVKEFTIEDYTSFEPVTAPAYKTGDSHIYKWESFAIDANKLENITINSVKLAAVTLEYDYPVDYKTNNNFGYFGIFVQVDDDGKVVKDGENVIIYTTDKTNANIAIRYTSIIDTINTAICSIADNNVFAVPVKIELFDNAETSQGSFEITNDADLLKGLNDVLNDCVTTGYYIVVDFE